MAIQFLSADIPLRLKGKNEIKLWVKNVIQEKGMVVGDISFVFCSDGYLLEKNRAFLKHDFLTDVITFDYCEGKIISGDILISLERIRENSQDLCLPFSEEVGRVMIHGVLHLMGLGDKTKVEKALMREAENAALEHRGNWLVPVPRMDKK